MVISSYSLREAEKASFTSMLLVKITRCFGQKCNESPPEVLNLHVLNDVRKHFAQHVGVAVGCYCFKLKINLVLLGIFFCHVLCSMYHKNTVNVSGSVHVPEALVFGSDDFVADIGAVRTKSASELLYARQKMVRH